MSRLEIVSLRTRSQLISTVIAFAALCTVLDLIPGPITAGVWTGWIFVISPLAGIILGPYLGFLTVLISVMVGHGIYFRGDVYEFVFTLGAPVGAATSALMFRERWKGVWLYYTAALLAYFATPVAWQLPLWGIWDILLAYLAIIPATILMRRWSRRGPKMGKLSTRLALCTLIGLEADVLFRVFVLVPGQTYWLFYGWGPEVLQAIWTAVAWWITPAKVAISAFITTAIGTSLARSKGRR